MDAVAVAEANVADANKHGKPNGETENRFQRAIAAWRSQSRFVGGS